MYLAHVAGIMSSDCAKLVVKPTPSCAEELDGRKKQYNEMKSRECSTQSQRAKRRWLVHDATTRPLVGCKKFTQPLCFKYFLLSRAQNVGAYG